MKRRDFMRAAGGASVAATAAAGAAQPAAASSAEGGEGGSGGGGNLEPDFGAYLDDANLYESAEDLRDQDEVTISVGGGDGLAFDPPAIWISPGTTVTWEWTGEGGAHNVVANEGPAEFNSGDPVDSSSATYEFEFTEDHAGITTYYCNPHETSGMKGGIAVGDDVPTIDTSGPSLKDPSHFGVDIHEHWVGVSVILMITVSLLFTFFMLKYGESPHTSGGN
ncbi:halocyanin domain-containing protein [Natronomonas gomsonensis]|jgi:halocyanin-like protein|uniref:halocyanin domain-containing protein n=1 Tax=Natronomonas gomsonensis TaxID=1046043 RepID=UPI0020CA7830|nr:halocyanin domain-containing protein [Natronomonas gomsonensis]MCY4731513.1 halocyanin domain-containing protein [Natronomonas gomsonensis]